MRSLLRSIYLGIRRIPLALCRPLFGRKRELPESMGRLLVIRWDRIGDMVLSTPVFKALKHKYPDAVLDVLASPTNAPVLRGHPAVDHVITWEGAPRSLWSLKSLGAVRKLRRAGYDLAIDMVMDWPLSSALLSALLAPYRIGFTWAGRDTFFTLQGTRPDRCRHLVDNNARLLESIEVKLLENLPYLGLPRKNPPFALTRIGIHTGGYFSSQRWPIERWVELTLRIKEDYGIGDVVLLLDPIEREDLEAVWKQQLPGYRIVQAADACELILAAGELDALLCNNSGPLHMAGALGIPTISTLGPTNPDMWWPIGDRQVVVQSPTDSVEDISVEQMLEGWRSLQVMCKQVR